MFANRRTMLMLKRVSVALGSLVLLAAALGGSSESISSETAAQPDPARVGRWEGPFPIPLDAIHAIHAALLPTGKVLMSS